MLQNYQNFLRRRVFAYRFFRKMIKLYCIRKQTYLRNNNVYRLWKGKVILMFEIGDYVVKANSGICKIEEMGRPDIPSISKDKLYFILVPIEETKTKLYVSIDKAEESLRKVITEKEAWEIINEIPTVKEAWITDDRQREQKYKAAIQSGDLKELISIIKNMYSRRQQRIAAGKKSTSVDEHFFKLAENYLYTELAFAIGEKKENMRDIIMQKLGVMLE